MDKIAVLIPCYNEEKTIAKVVSDVKKFLPEAVTYVYDNNSTDRTVELATEAGAIIRHEYAQGKGNVIRRMFREIDAECYLMIDGDDTYPLDCAREMVAKVLEHQADMVVGDRLSSTYFTENKRPFHNFGNSLMRAGINGLFHSDIKDIMTGYRAFSYEFVKTFPVFSKGFEIETEMTIHAVNYNMQVENVVVEYRDRPQGSESKLNTYSDGFRVIRKMLQLYEGQLAVGAVVMNRVRSGAYPSSIHGVIYASGQFTPALNGKVNTVYESGKINASCIKAAEEAISGVSNVGDLTHFRRNNGRDGIVIGNHVFY